MSVTENDETELQKLHLLLSVSVIAAFLFLLFFSLSLSYNEDGNAAIFSVSVVSASISTSQQ